MSAQILWRNLAVITVIIILEVTSVLVHQIISSMRIRKHVEVSGQQQEFIWGQVERCNVVTFNYAGDWEDEM